MKVKIGVIGGGRIGYVHTKAIQQNVENGEVIALADGFLNAESKANFEKLGVKKFYDDYQDLLTNSEIDAVYICSPTDSHYQYSIAALKAGKHVFCEKPVSFNLNEIKDVAKVIAKTGKIFTVGHNRRFDHNFLAIKNSLATDKIGQLVQLKITSRDPGLPPLEYIKKSGGLFLDMMIHDFDMVRFLVPEKIKSVYAIGDALINSEIKQVGDIDTAIVVLTFESGAMAVIDNCRLANYGYDQRVEVHGLKGALQIQNDTASTLIVSSEVGIVHEKPLHFFLERYWDAYVLEDKLFIEAVLNHQKPQVSIEDGYQAVLLAKAAQLSLKEKRPVTLAEVE
ncbi:inositol 2-dehydrogenase [Candidatus Mycoplasma pogonae]